MTDSDDAARRQAHALAVSAARAIILGGTDLFGPPVPDTPVTLPQASLGGELVGYDARLDAAARIDQFRDLERSTEAAPPDLPRTFSDALNAAAAKPTVRTLRRAEAAARKFGNGLSRPHVVTQAALRLADGLLYAQAALGDPKANAACSAISVQRFWTSLRAHRHAEAYLALRAAIHFAVEAGVEIDEAGYVPEPKAPLLTHYDEVAGKAAESLAIVYDALRAIEDEEDLLHGGAGASAPNGDDTLRALADLGSTFGDDRSDGAPARSRRLDAPSLEVLKRGGLDHLPGSESSGSQRTSRSGTPRGEWQPIAGVALPLVHGIDVVAVRARLDARYPWFGDLTALLLRDLAHGRHARLRHTLVVSPPGSGKTSYLRELCEACGLPVVVYSAAGVSDAAFGGTSRQWGTGRACLPLQTIGRHRVANPVIVLDEVEKGGTRSDNGRLVDSLVAFLEPSAARAFHDPYIEAEVDLSCVQYLATANGVAGIPGPLLDRFRVVHVGLPRAEDLPVAAASLVAEIREERGLDATWLPDLDGDEIALLARAWRGGSLRPLRRAVTALLDGRDALAPRH